MKLLLIDDHPLFRDGLSLLIQHRLDLAEHGGAEVLEAGSLGEAMGALQRHPDVGLVLLDDSASDDEGPPAGLTERLAFHCDLTDVRPSVVPR